jgi:hypothetical protein
VALSSKRTRQANRQLDDAIEFWDVTNREDWWIAEQSQAGITSRVYQPGPYSEREACCVVRRHRPPFGRRVVHRLTLNSNSNSNS